MAKQCGVIQPAGQRGFDFRWRPLAVVAMSYDLNVRWRTEIAVAVAGLLVLLALGVYFVVGTGDEGAGNLPGAGPLQVPAADLTVRLVPGVGQIRDLASLPSSIPPPAFEDAMPGTLVHVATTQIGGDRTHLFTWKIADNGQGVQVCTGIFGESGGGSGCGHEEGLDGDPALQWGNTTGVDNTDHVAISGAHNEAAWMVVETVDGFRVASNIVARNGYAEWDSRFGAPASVSLLDAQLGTIWSMPLDQP